MLAVGHGSSHGPCTAFRTRPSHHGPCTKIRSHRHESGFVNFCAGLVVVAVVVPGVVPVVVPVVVPGVVAGGGRSAILHQPVQTC